MSALAEEVLAAILEAQPVDVQDIRAAIASLHNQPVARSQVLERIAGAAGLVIAEQDAFNAAMDRNEDCDYEGVYDAVMALRPLLIELTELTGEKDVQRSMHR